MSQKPSSNDQGWDRGAAGARAAFDQEEDDDGAGQEQAPLWSRHGAPSPHPTRSGPVSCLGCGEPFDSWDRTRNRLCPRCAGRANRGSEVG